MGNEETFAMILQAKAETAAAFAQVGAQVTAMTNEITMQTRLAEASFGQLEAQTKMAEQSMAHSMASTAEAAKTHHGETISWFGRLKESMTDVTKVAAGFVAGQLITAGTMSIVQHLEEASNEVMRFGNQVVTMQRTLGGSAEDASGFTAVLDRLGISSETATMRIAFFDKQLVNHIDGLEGGVAGHQAFVETMQRLGVQTTDSTGKLLSGRDVLLNTFEAIKNMGTVEERNAAATQLFGRGGMQLMPAIMRGREGFEEIEHGSAASGLKMDDQQLDSIKRFKEAQRDMGEAVSGVSVQLGLLFLPAATAAAQATAGLAIAINQGVLPAFRAIGPAIGSAVAFMNEHRLVVAAVAGAITVLLVPALYAQAVAAYTAASGLLADALALAVAWAPVIGILLAVAAAAFLLEEAWKNNFGGIQEIVQNVVSFIQEKIAGLLDFLSSNQFLSDFFHVPKDWREQWGAAKDAVVGAVIGAGDAAGKAKDDMAAALAKILHPTLTPIEMPGLTGGEGASGLEANPFGLTLNQIKQMGLEGLAGLTALSEMKRDQAQAQEDFDQSQIGNQQALLELKERGLALEEEMLAPQQRLRDLQASLKDYAAEGLRLEQERKLLLIDSANFEQNANLRRINQQISQAQDSLSFTRSPMEAAQLNASIEAMKQQAFQIRSGMFGSDTAKLGVQIDMDRAKLDADLAKNVIDQQINDQNAILAPMQARKNLLDDQTKAIEHQMAVSKASFDLEMAQMKDVYNQSVANFVTQTAAARNISPEAVRAVLKAVGLTDSASDKAAATTATLEELRNTQLSKQSAPGTSGANSFTGGGGTAINAPVTVNHQWNVEINNPQMDSATGVDATITSFRVGLEEAAAAGTPIAPLGSSTDIP